MSGVSSAEGMGGTWPNGSGPSFAVGEDHPWQVLADEMGAGAFHPFTPNEAVYDYYDDDTDVAAFVGEALREVPEAVEKQSYKGSMILFEQLGALMTRQCLETPEGVAALESLHKEWWRTMVEIVKLDPELREALQITDVDERPIIDGHIMTHDGKRRMYDLTEDGAEMSRREALKDERWITQFVRDRSDTVEARHFDDMAAGRVAHNTRLSISRSIKTTTIQKDPEFWHGKGYREDYSFIRLGYMGDEGKAMFVNLSLDGVTEATFLQALAEEELRIPHAADSDRWVEYGVNRHFDDSQQALEFALSFRQRCYDIQGDRRQRQEAGKFMEGHQARIDAHFNALCLPLALSIDSRWKNPVLHQFVSALLSNTSNMASEVIDILQDIQQAEDFDVERGRFLAGAICYAVAEDIRDEAKKLIRQGDATYVASASPYVDFSAERIARFLAQQAHVGIQAGRSHGGPCPGVVSMSLNPDGTPNDPLTNPLGVFGGRDSREAADEDDKGPLTFQCPNKECLKVNRRDRGELLSQCKYCKAEVRC